MWHRYWKKGLNKRAACALIWPFTASTIKELCGFKGIKYHNPSVRSLCKETLLLFSREDVLLYIIIIKHLQGTIGLQSTFKAFLFVVPHKMLSTLKNNLPMKKPRCRKMMANVSVTQRVTGALRGMQSLKERGIPSISLHLKMCQKFLFAFKSQDQFSCVFLQSFTLLHNKYLWVIFCGHRLYLQNSYIMIDTVPYPRRRRLDSSTGMCKDGLRYRSYHFPNWRPQI